MQVDSTQHELTITQAAQRLGVSYSWVSKLIRRGDLAATGRPSRRGHEWRITESELRRFERSRGSDTSS